MLSTMPDKLILQYLDGVAPAHVAAQIVNNAALRQRTAQLSETQHALKVALQPNACPSHVELLAYLDNEGPLHVNMQLFRHLQGCASCRASFKEMQAFLEDDANSPDIFYPVRQQSTRFTTYRSAAGSMANDITFKIDSAEINLSIKPQEPQTGVHNIWGLATGIDSTAIDHVTLTRAGEEAVVASAEVDEIGGFYFESMPQGQYELHIDTDPIAYVLRGIELS